MIILDTHIFLWMTLQQEKIPTKIMTIAQAEDLWGVSAISLWEISMLSERKRIQLPLPLLPWLREALDVPRVQLLPLTPEVAARSESLPMHGDPADRIIAATAMELNCRLATLDRLLIGLPMLQTLPFQP